MPPKLENTKKLHTKYVCGILCPDIYRDSVLVAKKYAHYSK